MCNSYCSQQNSINHQILKKKYFFCQKLNYNNITYNLPIKLRIVMFKLCHTILHFLKLFLYLSDEEVIVNFIGNVMLNTKNEEIEY